MFPLTQKAAVALQHLTSMIEQIEVGVHLETGDLLLVNNHKVLHRRGGIRASHDEHDRLLMRAYAQVVDVMPADRVHPMAGQTE